MRTMMRRLALRRDDRGVAIVAAMGVVMLVGILVAVTITIAMQESKMTGRDRQRSSGVATAESQVDLLTAQIQSSAPAALTSLCGPVAGSTKVAGDSFSLASTVTYYDTSGNVVPCSQVATTLLAQAKIHSTATSAALAHSAAAVRTVESLIKLTPAYANNLDKAIFSDSSMTMSNKTVLKSASATPNADIYTNGNFTCNNNEEFHGSIYAQGSIYLNAQCTVSVDVWAKIQVSVTNPSASIGGRALSAQSTIGLDKAALGQQARAAGAVTGQVCSTAGKCFGNLGLTAVNPPPVTTFPQLKWDSTAQSAWVANGYTNVVTFPQGNFVCGWYNPPNGTPDLVGADGKSANLNGKASGVGAWLFANAYKLPADTIVISNCPSDKIILQGIGLTLNKNIVLLSLGGISFTGNTTITSVTGTATAADPNLLYFIQPYSYYGTVTTCSGEGITLDNQVTVDNTVNTLLYSPCAIRKANQSEIVGQVYSGSTLTIDNQFNMTYIPLPVWGGLASPSSQVNTYSVDTMYKREAQ